jgi:phospholipase/lecithinase/hemolysin
VTRLERWLVGPLLLIALSSGCSSTPKTASPTHAQSRSGFGQSLSLTLTLGSALTAGDTSVKAQFALTNKGSSTFEGCFGPSWGVSVIEGGHNAGNAVSAEHPQCVEKLKLLAGQTIVWSKTVPINDLRAGTAKVTGWAKVIDPAACKQSVGCHEVSIASPLMTVPVGKK